MTFFHIFIPYFYIFAKVVDEIKKLLNDQPYLDKILLEGVEKANSIASKKIDRIKEILGF